MNSIDIAFSLVKGMTKSEKRYFKMMSEMQKGEKGYIALFDALDEEERLDEMTLKKLKVSFPGNALETSRKHLYKVIMKSLRQFSHEDIDVRIMNLLHDARILHNKGLIKPSFDVLDKIKSLSLHREKFGYYILAARLELQFLVREQFVGMTETDLLEKQNKVSEIIEQESKLNKHSILYEILHFRYYKSGIARSQHDVTQLNDLLLEEYQLLRDPGYKSFEADQLHLHFQSTYFQMTANPQGSLEVFHDLNTLFQEHEKFWIDTPLYYVQLLDGILHGLRQMDRYDDMDFFIGQLEKTMARAGDLELIVKYRIMAHELNKRVDQEMYEEAMKLLEHNVLDAKKDAEQLPFLLRCQLMLAIARTYLSAGQYSPALRIINNVLNQPLSTANQSVGIQFQLMNLLVNALMNDVSYVQHALRSIERKLKADRKLYDTELLILSSLKAWVAFKPAENLDEKLIALCENPFERQLIKDLCLKQWVKKMKFRKTSVRRGVQKK